MPDAGIRPKRHNDLGGDLPFFAGAILATGFVVGSVVAFVVDKILHRHRP